MKTRKTKRTRGFKGLALHLQIYFIVMYALTFLAGVIDCLLLVGLESMSIKGVICSIIFMILSGIWIGLVIYSNFNKS